VVKDFDLCYQITPCGYVGHRLQDGLDVAVSRITSQHKAPGLGIELQKVPRGLIAGLLTGAQAINMISIIVVVDLTSDNFRHIAIGSIVCLS